MSRSNFATKLANWDWLLYLLLLPVAVAASDWLAPLLPLLLLSWLLQWRVHGRPLPRTPVDGALLLLALMALVGLAISPDRGLSLPRVAALLYGLASAYRAVAILQRRPQGLFWLLLLMLLFGWGIVGLSLLGAAWPRQIPGVAALLARLPIVPQLAGGEADGYNPNEIAGALLWVTPLAWAVAMGWLPRTGRLASLGRWQPLFTLLWFGSALVFTATVLFSFSRGGILGLLLALALLVWLLAGRWRRYLLALGGLLILAGIVTVSSLGPAELNEQLGQIGLNAASDNLSVDSLAGRQEIWSRALYAIQDFPLTGTGPGLFRELVPILYPLFRLDPTIDVAHAHNQWLQAALDWGLPGLVALLALWLGLVGCLWRTGRFPLTPLQRNTLYGLAATLAGYFTYSFLDTIALGARPSFIFWTLVGLVVGLHNAARR